MTLNKSDHWGFLSWSLGSILGKHRYERVLLLSKFTFRAANYKHFRNKYLQNQ